MSSTRDRCRSGLCARGVVLVSAALGLCVLLAGVALADEPSGPASPELTLAATPDVVRLDQPVTVTAQLAVPGAALTVSRRVAGQEAFALVEVATVGADGAWTRTFTPRRSTTYRVEFAGDAQWAAATAEITVAVQPRLTLDSSPAPVYEGQKVTFSGRVQPLHPGGAVMLERRIDGVWTAAQTLTLDAKSRASYVWRSDVQGKLAFRLVMAEDLDHAGGVSGNEPVTVKDPNPYGVPASAPRILVADKSEYKLYYHEYGRIVRVFGCVLGKPSTPTPLGRFKIYAMDPEMYGPYGPRRMRYLGPYAIHGTNEPWLLKRFPRAYSHGCTRLSNANILWLYARCRVGTPVWNVR